MGIIIQPTDNVQWKNPASLSFDGSTEYMTFDGLAGDIDTGVGTVSAWVKLDSTTSNGVAFKASVDSSNVIALTYNNSASKIQFTYKAGGSSKVADAAFAFEGNETWYNVVGTYNTSEDYVKIAINGEVLETTTGLGTWSGTIDKCYAARNTLASNSFWEGHITNIAYYASDLTNKVSWIYNNGTPGNLLALEPHRLKLWLNMAEQSGTSVHDSSGLANNATLLNTPTWSTDKP